ncbi:MAG: ATP-binding protein [Rhodospirillales bacterium]
MALEDDIKHKNLRDASDDVSRFRDYADADADLFWELDPNFRFAIVSLRREGRSSVREYDLLGKTPWAFADADPDRDPEWAAFVDKLQRREPFRDFRMCLRRNGVGLAYWRFSGKPVVAADGMFFGYRGIATDDTVEQIRRTQLENLAGDYQIILESLSEGVAYFDDRQRLSLCNAAFRKLIPVPVEHVKAGASFAGLMEAVEPQLVRDRRKNFQTGVAPGRGLIDWHFQSGQRLTGDIRALPSGGQMLSIYQPGNDTSTDRFYDAIAEQALSAGETKYRNLVEGSIQGLFVHRDMKILYANTTAAMIFGYDVDEFIGQKVMALVSPRDQALVDESIRRRLAGDPDVPERYELVGVRKDGSSAALEVFSRAVDWEGGTAIQVTLMDISDRKEIESHLLAAKDAAEHADRTKTEFLANMSHELRTPLNAIIGFSQLIRGKIMGELNTHYVDYAGAIHASGVHLLDVVNDLLDIASIESGALSLNEDELEIGDVIRSCERMLRPRAQKAELLISVTVPEQGIFIRGDMRRLKQIMINLINNAIKFTKADGHVIVRAYCNEQGQPVFEVEDTGIGISEQDQKVIFEAFVRVNSAFVAQREGTGLGLPLVHALTALHGGEVRLDSALGVGTKIAVILPKERLIVRSAEI